MEGHTALPKSQYLKRKFPVRSSRVCTGFLRSYADDIQPKDGESTYRISIHFPERDVSVQVIGSRYLFCDNRWLKIADKEWDTIFQGILDAG